MAPRNTVGDIPLVEWHKDEEHIGYDIKGKKLKKQPRKDKLASFLEGADDPKNWYLKLYLIHLILTQVEIFSLQYRKSVFIQLINQNLVIKCAHYIVKAW